MLSVWYVFHLATSHLILPCKPLILQNRVGFMAFLVCENSKYILGLSASFKGSLFYFYTILCSHNFISCYFRSFEQKHCRTIFDKWLELLWQNSTKVTGLRCFLENQVVLISYFEIFRGIWICVYICMYNLKFSVLKLQV